MNPYVLENEGIIQTYLKSWTNLSIVKKGKEFINLKLILEYKRHRNCRTLNKFLEIELFYESWPHIYWYVLINK